VRVDAFAQAEHIVGKDYGVFGDFIDFVLGVLEVVHPGLFATRCASSK
jgi:hypothetical protein